MRADDYIRQNGREPCVDAVVASVNTARRTVMVTVDLWDGGSQRHGPCPYLPHAEGGLAEPTHPRRGTPCCLLETATGGLHIASWSYP